MEFVRERHAFAQQDLARVRDQQAFSDAAKRTLLSPLTWPRYPAILTAFERNLITNIPLNDLPELGVQAALPTTSLNHYYINEDNGMVHNDTSSDGQSILLPSNSTAIPDLVHKVFSDPTLANEHASVAILNATTSPGLATDMQGTLQGLGFNVVSVGNAGGTYTRSKVIVNTSVDGTREYTARRLQRILNATLVHETVSGQSAQIVVVLGGTFP
ncbi:MAG: hypothetical protein DLM70_11010 [Chloroflexi bacterium]|nr:MAG: hypothetical protein DLM70_11010 [Chloroflexota bacterium]